MILCFIQLSFNLLCSILTSPGIKWLLTSGKEHPYCRIQEAMNDSHPLPRRKHWLQIV